MLIDIGAHLLQGLVDAGYLLHMEGVPRNQGAVAPAHVAAHGRLIVACGPAAFPQLLQDQAGHIGLAHIRAGSHDEDFLRLS